MKSQCELVRRGIDPARKDKWIIDICLKCNPEGRCVSDYVHGKLRKVSGKVLPLVKFSSEWYQCPCGAFETLNFSNGVLESTIKYYQNNGQVFHKCGTELPCAVVKI